MKKIFCLTSDVDWAEEYVLEEAYKFFDSLEVPVTPFITNYSHELTRRFKGKEQLMGLHPSFFESQANARSLHEALDKFLPLNPESKGFRCHSYLDCFYITDYMKQKGFLWDSNMALHLEPYIRPVYNASGLLRFPTWLEDYHFLISEKSVNVKRVLAGLKRPGLKVLNIHPIHVFLNTVSTEQYACWKRGTPLKVEGKGIRDLTLAVVDHAKKLGYEFMFLDDLYRMMTE